MRSLLLILLFCTEFTARESFAANRAMVTPLIVSYRTLQFDLSMVHDPRLQLQLQTALNLGFASAQQSSAVRRELSNLIGARTLWLFASTRRIQFYSSESEMTSSTMLTGAPALANWWGAYGFNDMLSPPSSRVQLRVFLEPDLPYWYVVSSLWHELLHLTLNVTHHQTTAEGAMPAQYVNDAVWFSHIKAIMLAFPRIAVDPWTGKSEELYNPENNPWS